MISQQPWEAGLIERVTPMLQRQKQPQRQWCLSSALVKQGRWQPRPIHEAFDSLVAQRVKRLPAMTETWVQSLGQEDPLEKKKATHSSTLAWRIPWTEKPGRLQSIGSQRVGHDWATSLSLSLFFWKLYSCGFTFKSLFWVNFCIWWEEKIQICSLLYAYPVDL